LPRLAEGGEVQGGEGCALYAEGVDDGAETPGPGRFTGVVDNRAEREATEGRGYPEEAAEVVGSVFEVIEDDSGNGRGAALGEEIGQKTACIWEGGGNKQQCPTYTRSLFQGHL
jgi:hypothetical protein